MLLRAGEGEDPSSAFKQALADHFRLPHVFQTPSCRAALLFLLEALVLPKGSEVILAPITHPDMVNMVILSGLRPVFVDLGTRTGSLDPSLMEERITDRTGAVLVTHLHGIPADMGRILGITQKHGLHVIEDISYGLEARFGGHLLGTKGTAAVFSTSVLKPVNTLGGGVILTSRPDLAELLERRMQRLGQRSGARVAIDALGSLALSVLFSRVSFSLFTSHLIGAVNRLKPGGFDEAQKGNLSLVAGDLGYIKRRKRIPDATLEQVTDRQAAIGLHQLKALTQRASDHKRNAGYLAGELKRIHPQALPVIPEAARPAYWQFPIWVEDRGSFRTYLFDRGVDTSVGGLPCCSEAPAFADFFVDTPEARRYSKQCLFLPIHSGLSQRQLRHMVHAVARFWRAS